MTRADQTQQHNKQTATKSIKLHWNLSSERSVTDEEVANEGLGGLRFIEKVMKRLPFPSMQNAGRLAGMSCNLLLMSRHFKKKRD